MLKIFETLARAKESAFSAARWLFLRGEVYSALRLLFWLAIAYYGLVFIGIYAGFLFQIAGKFDQLSLYMYDWPDTAFFTKLIGEGRFFSDSGWRFIAGGQMAGFFPPLFHILAFAVNFAFNDMNTTLAFLSFAMSFMLAYLLLKDWPDWRLRAILFLLLFLPPFQYLAFPLIMRLRELFALLLLVLMFKNPLKLGRVANYLVCGSLLVLSQPLIALMGIAAYFILDAKTFTFRVEKRMAAPLLILAALFLAVYSGHFAGKFLSPGTETGPGFQTIGCAYNYLFSHGLLSLQPYLILFLVIPFFAIFLPTRDLKLVFFAFVAMYYIVWFLQFYPPLFLKAVSLLREDLCVLFSPYLSFFAIFPPGKKAPGGRGISLAVLTILAALLAIQVPLRGNYYLPIEFRQGYDELVPSFQPGTKILSVRLFFWEEARAEYFVSFDFRLMSLMALMGKQNTFYYSPMQQFYDSEHFLATVKGFLDSAYAGDREGCIKAADSLEEKIDYLHLHAILSDPKNSSLGYSQLKRLADKSFLESCGVELVLPFNGFPRNSSKNESVIHYVFRMNGARAPAIRS